MASFLSEKREPSFCRLPFNGPEEIANDDVGVKFFPYFAHERLRGSKLNPVVFSFSRTLTAGDANCFAGVKPKLSSKNSLKRLGSQF